MTNSVLNRIADYFRNWDGVEENAQKLEISVAEMREIAQLNVNKCNYKRENEKLKEEISRLKEKENTRNCTTCIDKDTCAIFDDFNIDYCSD